MLLIIETAREIVLALFTEIEEFEAKLKQSTTLEEAKKKLEEINTDFESFNQYLSKRKTDKLKKDIMYFTLERTYPYLAEQYYKQPLGPAGLKRPSSFAPSLKAVGPEVAIFEKAIVQKIEDMLRHIPKSKSKLDKEDNMALRKLRDNNKITVKSCDKGGGIAVLDPALYMEKMSNMLQCSEFYRTVPGDPESMIKRCIKDMNSTALVSGLICQKEYDFLRPEYTRFPII
ncbi:hypothetical protein NDU88_009790 [Pleurodeles waltl]|uniref:Uncharacterized protein n=1 Tax=Pleurodeles waltl TaxID=8319 RepID=A0AAV7PT78_PLEWA|nr:hypothetical protein NDU88_009790 [Pleurodeles waltl]